MLFNIFNNDLDTRPEFTRSRFSDHAKLGGLAAKSGGCSEEPQQTGDFARGEPHEVIQLEVLGTWGLITLCTTTHWGLIDWKAALQSRILVWVIKWTWAGYAPLPQSWPATSGPAFGRGLPADHGWCSFLSAHTTETYPKCWAKFWTLQNKREMSLLEWVQWRATRMIYDLWYEARLRVEPVQSGKKLAQRNLSHVLKYLMSQNDEEEA